MTGDGSKVQCCKEQLVLHTNLECKVHQSRQIGSGQQEMARVIINILGISEIKWTGMGEFN